MIVWRLHHVRETVSTNLDARAGRPGDVYSADFQTAGRGRLDHRWLSAPGENLMMSVVLSVEGLAPDHVATLPLVVGLAVSDAVGGAIKWPNDVLVEGRKLAGILCERIDDRVIAGIGVNVGQCVFPPEIADRATSLARLGRTADVASVRTAVLTALATRYTVWREGGLAALHSELAARDVLRGRWIAVRQTDNDVEPVQGLCGGICADGTLDVGGTKICAGEAHVCSEMTVFDTMELKGK